VPDGEGLLLLHGFTNTHRSWRRLLDAGLADGAPVLAPDIRGHGDAGDLRPVDLDSVLADLDGLAPADCTLVGYSQGGRIALHAALEPRLAPRMRRLVLLSASPGIADPAERALRRAADEALAQEAEAMSIEAFATRWGQVPILSGLSDALTREAYEDRLHNSTAGLAAALRGLGTGSLPSLWERLSELTLPVTIMAGERDEKFIALAEAMVRQIPQAELEVIAGAGHQVHLEQPAAVLAALVRPRN
jgi:2-succinyl-6-hydroxy-2,4-cyclohexadiene-1-carboxylate synthase